MFYETKDPNSTATIEWQEVPWHLESNGSDVYLEKFLATISIIVKYYDETNW